MANQEQLVILRRGVEVWNQWRKQHANVEPDFLKADLEETYIPGADLTAVNFTAANLREANLYGANLTKAILEGADLTGTNLEGVIFTGAVLWRTNFSRATFGATDMSGVQLWDTVFAGVDLSQVRGLESADYMGKSYVDIHTIYRSKGNIPEVFLKGAGIDDTFIEYIHSLVGKPIQYYSCFISYSSKDDAFAKRLYADLQSHNVRCWFAPENMKIGDRIRPRIDESIRLHDKLLLILSEHSVASKWVEFEVEAAMDKEKEGKPPVLFPVRLDNAIMDSTTAWAAHIKRTRNIGNFTSWKNHDDYQKAFKRLLRDLKASS